VYWSIVVKEKATVGFSFFPGRCLLTASLRRRANIYEKKYPDVAIPADIAANSCKLYQRPAGTFLKLLFFFYAGLDAIRPVYKFHILVNSFIEEYLL
jgi:hypothetical protein